MACDTRDDCDARKARNARTAASCKREVLSWTKVEKMLRK